MKAVAVIFLLLAAVLGIGALSQMSLEGAEGARALGRMIGTVLFPAIFAVVGVVLWKKASKASETT